MKNCFKLMCAAFVALASFVPAQAETLTLYDGTDYLAAVPDGFTKLTVVNGVADNVTATNAHKGTLLAVNAAGQVVAASAAITVVA